MLSKEQADQRLQPYLIAEEIRDQPGTRFASAIRKLPRKLSEITFPLCGWSKHGDAVAQVRSHYYSGVDYDCFAAYAALKRAEQLKILKIFFPAMADDVAATWDALRLGTYQVGYQRKAFRAPNQPELTLRAQAVWLYQAMHLAQHLQEDVLTPEWLATWFPHLHFPYYNTAGNLAATVIDAGGRRGAAMRELLFESGRNEHEIGGMGRHVLVGLMSSSQPECWEFIEKMLIAAQRQEGLRQSILEAVDFAHPNAFRRMLRLVLEADLVRFSAVARAVDVWLGMNWGATSVANLKKTLAQTLTLLEDESKQIAALNNGDAQQAYLALWTQAFLDVDTSLSPAESLLEHPNAEHRYAAVAHLRHLGLTAAEKLVWRASDDTELAVAARAAGLINQEWSPSGSDADGQRTDRFERLERLIARLPAHDLVVKPLVWPWTEGKVNRQQAANLLAQYLEDRPPTSLVPYLPAMDVWRRVAAVKLIAQQKKWDAITREAVVNLAGDSATDVRAACYAALEQVELTPAEIQQIEGYLTRKSADVRSGVLKLLLKQTDNQALDSATRLTTAKDANQRLGGLELWRVLAESGRQAPVCKEQARGYLAARPRAGQAEVRAVEQVLNAKSPEEVLTLDNALGLMDPTQRSPVKPPRLKKVKLITPAAIACLQDLDKLIDQHREAPIVTDTYNKQTMLLGAISYGFPYYRADKSPETERKRLPLVEVWESWFEERGKKLRDADGLELLRAERWLEATNGWSFEQYRKWALLKPERQPLLDVLQADAVGKLKYPQILGPVLRWLLFLHPSSNATAHLLDVAEDLCARVPQSDLENLCGQGKQPEIPPGMYFYGQQDEFWRGRYSAAHHWMANLQFQEASDENLEFSRYWQLLHWLDEPLPGAIRKRPDLSLLMQARQHNLANRHDVADELVGPRDDEGHGYGHAAHNFRSLSVLTSRKTSPETRRLLSEHPELSELVEQIRSIILESELERGELPTATTLPALSLQSLTGIETLIRLLTTLGKSGFKVVSSWQTAAQTQRAATLTHLVKITYPADDDTAAEFITRMKTAIKAQAFPEDRLMELAFLAPQWTRFIEDYYRWDGLAEGLYWFLAHMRFMWGSTAGEQAAESAGIEDETPAADSDAAEATTSDADDDNDDEPESRTVTPQKTLSAWERLILERTALTDIEREQGAIDVVWFQRVYQALGPKKWERLAQSAKFASNAAQAKKAQLIADVLLGKANLNDLIEGIEKRNLKDNVRLIGLYPLPTGTKRHAELSRRFGVLAAYGRYARTLSGLTKPDAMRALEIGLKNLASTAGYADALRLDWALGAGEWADLRSGSVSVEKDGVTVSLSLDESIQPKISIQRGEKVLKSAPPAVKKHPPIAELFERNRELKRQASRQKQALEAAMCRGDEFTAQELTELSQHALVAPFLERLVFVGDGILGYPVKKGKALRDHTGKLEPIKKSERLRIAHPYDLLQSGDWEHWQREAFQAERVQPFKQVFRELYVVTRQERETGDHSQRYAGQQVGPKQAYALWGNRGWNTNDGVFKVYYEQEMVVSVDFQYGIGTPLEVEGLTVDRVTFYQRHHHRALRLADVPPRIFSEVMRDVDLVVSVAHIGGVDPEASASTVEMRASLVRETCTLLGISNVRLKPPHVIIDGAIANYTIHLGSGTVQRMPGGALCVVPVHAQHRGRLFLPFADDDPRTAEVVSKILLFARDSEIQDPTILEQIRG